MYKDIDNNRESYNILPVLKVERFILFYFILFYLKLSVHTSKAVCSHRIIAGTNTQTKATRQGRMTLTGVDATTLHLVCDT